MALATRSPIVAVMGHIDHGKSSLLDYIRKANVVAGEAGGITQHVSAYVAEHTYEGTKRHITFLDTPGHEAFKALRARGAAAADIAILVIAADEGVKPQTIEAFSEITAANIPCVVAFTKIDKNNADIERGKIAALEAGIYLEGLGGSIPFAGVSSKSGDGVPELLDLVLLTSDLAELVGDNTLPAQGFVLESSQSGKRGTLATLIIKNGTLATGSFVVSGHAFAPVRFIEDFKGDRISSAGPSEPIVISGWNDLPLAGSEFNVVSTKKIAEQKIAEQDIKGATSFEAVEEGKVLFPIIVKADVSGSVEAVLGLLAKISHELVSIRVVASGIGSVTESDVKTASASGGVVLGFHTDVESSARDLAERLSVSIETFDIIYELETRAKELIIERAPKVTREETLGEMKILKMFSKSGVKQVLGARYLSGSLSVGSLVKVLRRDIEIARGKLINLQVARADVSEIHTEGEFGLQIEAKDEIAGGDVVVCFRITQS
jgi:translation initiation factor IF-2